MNFNRERDSYTIETLTREYEHLTRNFISSFSSTRFRLDQLVEDKLIVTMNAVDIAQTIQLIIAPVVLITACMLFENGVLMRYASIGQRIRTLTHERFELLHSTQKDPFNSKRLQTIARQLPILTERHRLVQKAALLTYSAIAIFIFTMFAIALSVALDTQIVGTIALMLFLLGTGTLLIGIFLMTLEIRVSHRALCYEVHHITALDEGIK